MGLYRAGFEVIGIDIEPQPHYPFEFHQADAFKYPLEGFNAYWASPVCKGGSIASSCRPGLKEKYTEQITPIRQRLLKTGKPYIIENVKGYRHLLQNPIMLCGTMFGLKVIRHRYFECSFSVNTLLPPCACKGAAGYTAASDGFSSFANGAKLISVAGHNFSVEDAKVAMRIDWMNQGELSQAIPPIMAEFLGKYMMQAVMKEKPKPLTKDEFETLLKRAAQPRPKEQQPSPDSREQRTSESSPADDCSEILPIETADLKE